MADYKGLNIRFRGDTTDASKALHILGTEAKNAQGNLNRAQDALRNMKTNSSELNAALKDFQLEHLGKQADVARQRFEAYRDVIPQLEDKLADLREEIDSTKAAMEGGEVKLFKDDGTVMNTDELAAHLNSVEEQERKTAAAIDSATGNMLAQKSAAQTLAAQHDAMGTALATGQTRLGQFGANATEAGGNLKSLGDSISSVGDKMTVVSGIAAMTFGRKVISQTEEFGNAISQLGGYLDIQGAQLEDMSDQALKWGKETQFSATEAANAMNELAKGGMTQAQISGGAMKATMELAAAGSLDMAQAAETAVQAIKTFGLSAEDSSAIADALAGAADQSTAEVTDLAQGFKYVGGWASMANWNINDVSGALALLSDHGLKSEMAGTALRNVMQRLAAPTDTAAKLMQQYGFSVRDSSGQMVSAVEVVRRLNDTFGKLGDEEKQNVLSDIFGARALPAAIALMNEGADSLQGYIDATTEAGYAGEMAQNRMGDLGWALEFLRGEAETAAVNFGTALTPTIKGAAEAIEDALERFNSLSDAQKEQIANTALYVAAAGPVISVVGHLTSGIGGLLGTLGTGASTMANFVKLMKDGGGVTDNFAQALANATTPMADTAEGAAKAATKAASLKDALGSMATGAIVAGIAAIGAALVGMLMDYIEHEQEFEKATDGLRESLGKLGSDVDAQASSIANTARSWTEVRDASRELNKAQADIADSMSKSTDGAAKASAQLDNYISTIEDLSEKGDLTAGEQEKLKDAVSGLNDILGTSVRIVDGQTGALSTNIVAIDRAADAYRKYAKVQATMDAYKKIQEQIIDNQIEMTRLQGEFKQNDLADMLDSLLIWGDTKFMSAPWLDQYHELNKSLTQARERSEELQFAEAELERRMDSASMSSDEYQSVLEELGIAAKGAGSDMGDMGDDAEDAASQTESAMEDASKAAEKAMKRQQEATYRERQRGYDAEYKALQKSLDAEYKAQQKAYDAEYKAAQKAFDAEYKQAQKAYDQEYKALQKQLDREYKEWQKAYDKEYKQRQKELDAQYDAYKKSLDSEADALKKSLDAKYDQRKKALDAELAQVKKANDARLKAQKKADDAETKAFKAETDRRVKALQAEYKERLRMLELQYGGSDIDAQIKALKDQTKAEQDEIKRRSQAEKKAELEKAVEQAQTRRKRADAEKALKDYLDELAQEQRENEREALIEQLEDQKDILKDELAAKKEALKDEYDARIEALKSQREAELEVIKEANDAEYETLKEQLDARYQARKDANDAILQQIKDANQLEVDNLKEHHSMLLENMKEQHTAQLEQLKEQQTEQLEQVKEGQQEQLENLKEYQQAELDALKESQQEQLDNLKEGQQEQLDALKESHQQQLDDLKQYHQDRLQDLKDAQEDELDALKAGGEQQNQAMRDSQNQRLEDSKKWKKGTVNEYRQAALGMGNNLITTLLGFNPTLATTTAGLYGSATKKMGELPSAYRQVADQSGNTLASTLKDKNPLVRSAAENVATSVYNPFEPLPNKLGGVGSNATNELDRGLERGGRNVGSTTQGIANTIDNNLSGLSRNSGTWGYDMMNNFNNNMVSYWNNTMSRNVNNISMGIRNMWGHSTPKEGPLKGDDVWFYHLMQNLDDGLKRGTPILMGTVEGIAEGMRDTMSADFMDDMLDGMRSRETELARQSRRMAEIVTEEFNPYATGNYSVGYDVKPMAQLMASGVTEALRSGIPQQAGPTIVVREMHVRDESDIRRVSQRLYQLEAQSVRRGL